MACILGIETSCDETAAAVVENRTEVRSNIVASQIEVHRKYGGVVPELASRHHVEAIEPVVEQALQEAERSWSDLDAIAVTYGPGLIGSLLVGVCAAKSIAWRHDLPLLAINHLEGHVRSAYIEHPDIPYPNLCLVVSGGHTHIYLSEVEGEYELLAKTRDDAAGEAYDKVAKLLGLGYPGGPVIDRLAKEGDEKAVKFQRAQMKDGSLDFSFSGLKSAVRREVLDRNLQQPTATEGVESQEVKNLVASFQRAVIDQITDRVKQLAKQHQVKAVLITGGVACNQRLRRAFHDLSHRMPWDAYFPSPKYTTDNAAMIAAAGFLHLERKQFAPLSLLATTTAPLHTSS